MLAAALLWLPALYQPKDETPLPIQFICQENKAAAINRHSSLLSVCQDKSSMTAPVF